MYREYPFHKYQCTVSQKYSKAMMQIDIIYILGRVTFTTDCSYRRGSGIRSQSKGQRRVTDLGAELFNTRHLVSFSLNDGRQLGVRATV